MPNAQTHMASVYDLLEDSGLTSAYPWLTGEAEKSAFFLGAISPDVRIVSGHSREETHFFAIEPDGLHLEAPTPAQAMVATWAELADPHRLGSERAAFVAGYMTHLMMDIVWVEHIVMKGIYIPGEQWSTRHPNWRLYSLLMTYLEYRAAERVPAGCEAWLKSPAPDQWLPFVADKDLLAWRDHVVERIEGGTRLISAMFAWSNGLTADILENIVLSEEQMADEVFVTIPKQSVLLFEQEATARSAEVVAAYLSGKMK